MTSPILPGLRQTAYTIAALLAIYATSYVHLELTLPKQNDSQKRMGTNPPSPLFATPGHPCPIKGEEKILQAIKSHIAWQLVEFADPMATGSIIMTIRKLIWEKTGQTVQVSWLRNASHIAPHDWRVKRIEFYWTLGLEGPAAAANCLTNAIQDMPKNGLVWLDLASAEEFNPKDRNKTIYVIRSYLYHDFWRDWEPFDLATLNVLAAREDKRLIAVLAAKPNDKRAISILKALRAIEPAMKRENRLILNKTPRSRP